jgi:hypothetical protein
VVALQLGEQALPLFLRRAQAAVLPSSRGFPSSIFSTSEAGSE